MRRFSSMFLCSAAMLGAALLFSSCSENKTDTGNEPQPDFVGNSILVPNEANSTVSITVEFDAAWQVSNQSTWFAVTPLSGNAGTSTLNISVLDTNPDLREKVASFMISCDGVNTQYYVIQDVTPGFNIANKVLSVDVTEQTCLFTLEGNVKYEAVPEVDWITVNSITYDSTLLADNVTYSKYMTSTIEMSVAQNTGDVREGVISLVGADGTTTDAITVSQFGELTADFTKDFFRRSFMIKHTATFCGPCYYLTESIHQLEEIRPDRMIYASFYQSSYTGFSLPWSGAYDYYYDSRGGGLPTAVINNYVSFTGSNNASSMANIIDEACDELPSNTIVAGQAILNGNELTANLSIAAKESGTYKIQILVLEDGIVYYQTGGGNNYVHNNVTIGEITPRYGEEHQLQGNQVNNIQISGTLPTISIDGEAHTSDPANLHIYVVVYDPDRTFTGSLGFTYSNYGNAGIVDNVTDIPVNGFTLFKYEE